MAKDIELDPLAGPDGGPKGRRLAKHWQDQINAYKEDGKAKAWLRRAEAIERRYRDERSRGDEDNQRRYNALWSNTEILRPALYGKCPTVIAERMFKDKDPVGRFAATILERGLRNQIEINGFDRAIRQAVTDFLLPGRGVVWVRYEPEIEDGVSLSPEPQTDIKDDKENRNSFADDEKKPFQPVKLRYKNSTALTPPQEPEVPEEEPDTDVDALKEEEEIEKLHSTGDRVVRESVPVDYVPWRDFITLPLRARTWAEVTAVSKRVYMSRDQLKRRFGKAIGNAIPLKKDDRGDRKLTSAIQNFDEDKGQVYEIWDAGTKKVYWIAEGYEYLCDVKDDPLNLERFFPVPEPLYANATNETLIPVPEFIQYQDQAIQIDELTQRIAMLTKACKVAGLYNAAAKDIQRLFQEGVENELIPVDDWAAFGDNGGVEGNIALLPVDKIITTLNELMQIKSQQIEEMDRLTGISDIMRGTTDARETLGAVRIKTNTSGTRISSRQNEVARFARDTICIIADVMSQHFSPKSIIEVSGAMFSEGLGPDDMPGLSHLQMLMQQPKPQAPPQLPGPQQGPPGMPGMGPPPMPPGGNVVPFQRPGMPGPGAGPNMPPMGQPGPPMGGQPLNGQVIPPGQPGPMPGGPPQSQLPPEIEAKLKALQRIASAIQLLRNERLRGFRVDIETDSTIYPDQAQEKQDRNEFLKTVTTFLQTSVQMGAAMPESIPLMAKMLQFGVRGYKVGRDLETAIEEFTETAMEMAMKNKQQQEQQPDYAAQKAAAEIDKTKAQAEQARSSAQKVGADIQIAQTQLESDKQQAAAEVQRQQMENEGERANSQADLQIKQMEVQIKQMEMTLEVLKAQIEAKSMGMESQMKEREAQIQESQDVRDQHMQSQEMAMNERQAQREDQTHQQQMGLQERQAQRDDQMAQQDMELKKKQANQPKAPPKASVQK